VPNTFSDRVRERGNLRGDGSIEIIIKQEMEKVIKIK
jgi:hypothetical protein